MNSQFLSNYKIDIVKISILGILFLILYSPTFHMFICDWNTDDNYSHGFLVPFIVAYLVWTKKDELQRLRPSPSVQGLFMLIIGLLVYLVGTIGAEWFLKRSSLIIVLIKSTVFVSSLFISPYFKHKFS